jgi:hypothetical protein
MKNAMRKSAWRFFAALDRKKERGRKANFAATCVDLPKKMRPLAGPYPKPSRSPAQRVRFGSEEQQNERAMSSAVK